MKTFDELLLNNRTKKQLLSIINRPSHGLVIIGPSGSGKLTIAQAIAIELLGLDSIKKLITYAYFIHIKLAEGQQDIPIDSIRQITRLLKLKVPDAKDTSRIVLIEDAQNLSEPAQNAMLKMLEEPPLGTFFILSVESEGDLLPTITSRMQSLVVYSVNLQQSLLFFEQKYKKEQIASAWRLSQGSVGLMAAILAQDNNHPLKLAIDQAKAFLRNDTYGKLLLADVLSRDKVQLSIFLEALARLMAALHRNSLSQKHSNTAQQNKLLISRKLVYDLQKALKANVSPKLITLELSLNLV
ncbi:AAA family ATPase [Candidatus Saccharibacteria bacterium]|nr:AAA family ATPase [Candidatus Saccharibacteria bacterium]